MAITATPYGTFLLQLGQGAHNLIANPLNMALLTSAYTPDFTNDYDFNAVSSHEVANDATTGGYQTGGLELTNKTIVYDANNKVATLNADNLAWNALTGTFRYAVLLDAQNSGNSRMIGLINFGIDRTYAAEPFTLSFPAGVLTIAGA